MKFLIEVDTDDINTVETIEEWKIRNQKILNDAFTKELDADTKVKIFTELDQYSLWLRDLIISYAQIRDWNSMTDEEFFPYFWQWFTQKPNNSENQGIF